MKKKRIIPVVLLRSGWIVQSVGFQRYRNLGNPICSVKRLSEWCADEMIYLDISREVEASRGRHDLNYAQGECLTKILEDVARVSFMPLTFGGGIRSLEDIRLRLRLGADKICLNTAALERPGFVREAAAEFGSQCIVVSIDVRHRDGRAEVMRDGGKLPTDVELLEWVRELESAGAGEILLNSVDRDGSKAGFDIPLLRSVCGTTSLPVIACGGAGQWEHFEEVLRETSADAVAAANLFQHVDQSVYLVKKHLFERGYPVRRPELAQL